MMLRHTANLAAEADAVDAAIRDVLASGARTPDIAQAGEPTMRTSEIGAAVERAVVEALERRWSYHAV
jgi:3-isopropylmalate dehydrogenase